MTELDDTDLEILRMLVEDARRPYSEIAETVGVSPPTVSDRVDRLRDAGVIRQFTLDLDQSMLTGGIEILVELDVDPTATEAVSEEVAARPPVEHAFATADGTVIAKATVPESDLGTLLEGVDADPIGDVEVRLLVESSWTPDVSGTAFAVECDECGNTVTNEGETAHIGGERYHFCCPSCRANFEREYERLAGGSA